MMGKINSKIAFIQKRCKNYSNISAEGLMYGIANIMAMRPEFLAVLLKQDDYEDREMFAIERRKASVIIRKAKLNLDLIKNGSSLVLPFFKGSEDSPFYRGLTKLEEPVYFHTIVSYVIDSLDDGYLGAFHVGNTMEDVFAYQQQLKEGTYGHASDESKDSEDVSDVPQNGDAIEEKISFEDSKWNEFQRKLVYFLASVSLEGNQIESISTRVKKFAESLIGTEQEYLLGDLYNSLFAIDGPVELKEARSEFSRKDINENLANLKAAGHKVMRNLWQCLERYKEEYADSRDRLLSLSEKYAETYQELTQRVIGQDYAVNEVVQACFDAELYENNPNHPQAVFLFAGPPGVGKTFLAQNVADILGRPFKAFDMASYSIEKSDLALIGVEPEFKNAGEGTLVGFVEDHPDAIILFDEIEKAHPDVTRLFLSVLEGARLENKLLSSNTDFTNTILIFTTNAGKAIYEDNRKNLSATPTDVIIKELRKEKSSDSGQPKFPLELCSRFASQHIIMFNHIGISDMAALIVKHMDEACKGIEEKLHISVEYDKRLALLLLMHFGNIDVRVVTGKARQFIRKEIYELSRQLVRTQDISRIKKIRFLIDDSRITDKARKFFTAAESEEALAAVVCDEATRKKLEDTHMERIRFLFIESEEKLLECDPDDVTIFMIDPYFEMCKVDSNILGLDDYDSVGLRIIKTLLQKNISAPIFMLESGRKVSQTDKNTLYMRGVEDTICLDGCDLAEAVTKAASEHILQKNCSAMLNRRKIFDFESLQEMPDADGMVRIKFYDITVKDSVNPEDQDLLINIEERPNVKFDDVIGAENAKAELKDFVKYLENPKAYMQHALAVPKGVLLYGPPGTGKTMLAKAMAGETDAAFISMSAAKLRSSGEESIERLFKTARKYAPAIIFLDEVDAIAHRRTGSAFSSSYDESLLNMLLAQMDGFEQYKSSPVFVVAATNFSVEVTDDPMGGGLDPAFMRRFGSKILIGQPNKAEKMKFLSRRLTGNGKAVLRNNVTDEGIKNIAERTPGESLAILENILELAFRNAARKSRLLDDELLDEAMEEYFYGEKRTRDEEQAYRTAVHEASHAYICALSGKKPVYLTVIFRGNFGGYMQREHEENKATASKEECIWSIRTSLAGRIGEMVVFKDEAALNTGAEADLRHASSIALSMLTSYGMYEEHLFSMSFENLLRSNLMPSYVEKAEEILKQQERECTELIEQGKDKIIAMAKALLEKNHLNQEEIAELLRD